MLKTSIVLTSNGRASQAVMKSNKSVGHEVSDDVVWRQEVMEDTGRI
jgi:hypothetical protein